MRARTLGKSILIGGAVLLLAAPAGAALAAPDDEPQQEAPLRQVLTQEQARKLRAEGDLAYERFEFAQALSLYARIYPYFTRDFQLNQRLGWLYMNRANPDYAKAAQHLRLAHELNPDDLDVVHDYARVLSWQRQFAEAVPLYRKLVEKRTGQPELQLEYARVLAWANQDADAIDAYQTYVNSRPSDFKARNEFGRLLARRRDFSGAMQQFNYVLRFQPESSEARLGLARVLSWSGQYQASLNEVEKVLAAEPENFEARVVKAYALLWLGRSAEARPIFEALQKEDPKNADVQDGMKLLAQMQPGTRVEAPPVTPATTTPELFQAQAAEGQGRFGEAAAAYRAHLARHPDDDQAQFLLARVLGWDRQFDESEKLLRAWIDKHPENPNGYLQLARVLNWAGHYDDAIEPYRRGLALDATNIEARVELARVLGWARRYGDSVREYRFVLAAQPNHKEARIGLVQTLLWSGELDEAERELAELRRTFPGEPQADVMARTLETMQAQRGVAREISPTASEEYFRNLVQKDPNNVSARVELADALLRKEDYPAAIEQLNVALGLKPDNDDVRLKLARVYSWNRQFSESARLYEEWLSRHPDDLDVRQERARVLSWGRFYDESIAEYRRILEKDPNRGAARMELARVLGWARRYDESSEEFSNILKRDPDNIEAWIGKGRVQAYQGRWQASLFSYESALRLDPNNAEARTGRAQTMLWSGRVGQARNLFQELQAEQPNNPTVLVGLASAEDSSGRPERALELLDHAASVEPQNTDVQILRDQIRSRLRPELRLRWGYVRDTERLNTWGYGLDFRFNVHPRMRNFLTVDFIPTSGPSAFFGYPVVTGSGVRFAPQVPINPFVPAPGLLGETDFPPGSLLPAGDRIRQSAAQFMFGGSMRVNNWFRFTVGAGAVVLRHGDFVPGALFPSTRTRFIYMAAPTFTLAGKWDLTLGVSRQYALYTPRSIMQTIHFDEIAPVLVYRPDDRTRVALSLWYRWLSPEFELPPIPAEGFPGGIWRQRGLGGTLEVTRILWRGERGEFETGYVGQVMGYTHPFGLSAPEFFVNPGFFTPNFYQRHAALVRTLWKPTNWLAWDAHGTIGPQQILHGSDQSFSATAGTRLDFQLTPKTTLSLGYDYFNTAGAGQAFFPGARTAPYHSNAVFILLHFHF
ncbi:MAG TPA: tetratricopeptide repeat protein [Candidatus Xenobia bacterium]|nr:tetratricopeptide repeat protein [Candidatus Xenobia bacterium]